MQAVDAGEIDEGDFAAAGEIDPAGVLFHGDAGKVGDFLAKPGEAVEKSGLAAVRWPNQDDRSERRESWRRCLERQATVAGTHRLVLEAHGQLSGGFGAEGDLRTIHLEYAGISAGGAMGCGDDGAGQETQFHKTAGFIRGQADLVQKSGLAGAKVFEVPATELHHNSSMTKSEMIVNRAER